MKIYPTSASFLISEDCNLRCKYCFECHNNKHMTKEVAKQSIDFLIENALKQNVPEIHMMLFGGEPFVNYELIDFVLNYSYEETLKKGISVSASMVTNCTIMNSDIEKMMREWINKIKFSVQLSIDGKKDTQDMFRVTRDGKGSFDLLEKNIPIWQDIFRHKPEYLCVHGCCNEDTVESLYENYLYFRDEWNFKSIWFIPIASNGWTSELSKVYEEQLNLITDDIIKRCKSTKDIREVNVYAPIDKCLHQCNSFNVPCGAGKSFVTITADGDIYPCHHFYFNDIEKETYLGNVFGEIDFDKKKIFDDYEANDLSCSKENCDCYDCYRCIAEAWCKNGSILSFENNGFKCEFAKIEKRIFNRLNKELKKMGLLNVESETNLEKEKYLLDICSKVYRNDGACNLVVVEQKKDAKECNGDCCSDRIEKDRDMELVHKALANILIKLDDIENNDTKTEDIVDLVIKKIKEKL